MFAMFHELPECHKDVFQMLLGIGANKRAGHRVARNLPFVKKKSINEGGMPVVKIPETIRSGCVHLTFLSQSERKF